MIDHYEAKELILDALGEFVREECPCSDKELEDFLSNHKLVTNPMWTPSRHHRNNILGVKDNG